MLFIHKTIVGDTAKCAPYLPLALSKVHYLYRIKSAQTQSFEVDGVSIRCHVIGEQGFVRLESGSVIYLESGFALCNNFRHGVGGASDPAIIYAGGIDIKEHYWGLMHVPEGSLPTKKILPDSVTTNDTPPSKFKSGEYSPKSFYKAPKLSVSVPSVVSARGEDAPFEGSGAKGSFPVSVELELKKETTARISPSIYSGKMRLFVQSVLGSSLQSFSQRNISANTDISPFRLRIGTRTIDWSSDGIFTSDDGTYWLVSLGEGVSVTKIKLTSAAINLSQWFVRWRNLHALTRKETSEYEAYIFADAQLDTEVTFKLPYSIPSISPMAYGWKFNWGGDEASCVSLRKDFRSFNDTPFQSSTQKVRISRNTEKKFHNELSPLEQEKMRWKVTSTDTGWGEAFTFAWSASFVWTPIWLTFQQDRFSGVNNFQTEHTGTADIYGWYDESDTWRPVTYQHGEAEVENYVSHDSFPPGLLVYAGLNCTYEAKNKTKQKHKFTISGAEHEVEISSNSYARGIFTASVGDDGQLPRGQMTRDVWSGNLPPEWRRPASDVNAVAYASPDWAGTADAVTCAAINGIRHANSAIRDAMYADFADRFTCYSNPFSWWCVGPNVAGRDSSYSRSYETGIEIKGGAAAVIIPFFDSESCYLFQTTTTEKTPASYAGGAGVCSDGLFGVMYGNHWVSDGPPAVWDILGLSRYYTYIESFKAPVTTNVVPPPTLDTVRVNKCYKKHDAAEARADNWTEMFDASIFNKVLDQGNHCISNTSAVYNYVNGSNVSPSQPEFPYNTGTFIGYA